MTTEEADVRVLDHNGVEAYVGRGDVVVLDRDAVFVLSGDRGAAGWWPSLRSTGARRLDSGSSVTTDGEWIAVNTLSSAHRPIFGYGDRGGQQYSAPGRGTMSSTGEIYWRADKDPERVVAVPRRSPISAGRELCSDCVLYDVSVDGRWLLIGEHTGPTRDDTLVIRDAFTGDRIAERHVSAAYGYGARFWKGRKDRVILQTYTGISSDFSIWMLDGKHLPTGFSCDADYCELVESGDQLLCACYFDIPTVNHRQWTHLVSAEQDGRFVLSEEVPHQDSRLIVGIHGMEISLPVGTQGPAEWLDRSRLLYHQGEWLVVSDVLHLEWPPGIIDKNVSSLAVDRSRRRLYYTVSGNGERNGLYVIDL